MSSNPKKSSSSSVGGAGGSKKPNLSNPDKTGKPLPKQPAKASGTSSRSSSQDSDNGQSRKDGPSKSKDNGTKPPPLPRKDSRPSNPPSVASNSRSHSQDSRKSKRSDELASATEHAKAKGRAGDLSIRHTLIAQASEAGLAGSLNSNTDVMTKFMHDRDGDYSLITSVTNNKSDDGKGKGKAVVNREQPRSSMNLPKDMRERIWFNSDLPPEMRRLIYSHM